MEAKRAGALQIAGAMAIWSTWGRVIRWLPGPAWSVSLYAGLFACLSAAVLWLRSGGSLRDLWPRSEAGRVLLLAGFFTANNAFFFSAYERTTVANAILTHYTAPAFVALLAPVTLGERLRSAPAAVLLACAGMVLLMPGVELSLGSRHFQGLLLGLASGAAYAGVVLVARRLTASVSPLSLIFSQNLITIALLAPWALRAGLPTSVRAWSGLALVGVVHAAGAGLLYLKGLGKVKAQVAAVLGYLEPLGAVLWAALFLGEGVRFSGILGGLLILGGGGLVVLEEGKQEAVS
ncbi:MAG: EamA family transporter [Deltaproteobacteria bacterium]|nr:EamA family transporter [Deltaproteobacteria bacterium]